MKPPKDEINMNLIFIKRLKTHQISPVETSIITMSQNTRFIPPPDELGERISLSTHHKHGYRTQTLNEILKEVEQQIDPESNDFIHWSVNKFDNVEVQLYKRRNKLKMENP